MNYWPRYWEDVPVPWNGPLFLVAEKISQANPKHFANSFGLDDVEPTEIGLDLAYDGLLETQSLRQCGLCHSQVFSPLHEASDKGSVFRVVNALHSETIRVVDEYAKIAYSSISHLQEVRVPLLRHDAKIRSQILQDLRNEKATIAKLSAQHSVAKATIYRWATQEFGPIVRIRERQLKELHSRIDEMAGSVQALTLEKKQLVATLRILSSSLS